MSIDSLSSTVSTARVDGCQTLEWVASVPLLHSLISVYRSIFLNRFQLFIPLNTGTYFCAFCTRDDDSELLKTLQWLVCSMDVYSLNYWDANVYGVMQFITDISFCVFSSLKSQKMWKKKWRGPTQASIQWVSGIFTGGKAGESWT